MNVTRSHAIPFFYILMRRRQLPRQPKGFLELEKYWRKTEWLIQENEDDWRFAQHSFSKRGHDGMAVVTFDSFGFTAERNLNFYVFGIPSRWYYQAE